MQCGFPMYSNEDIRCSKPTEEKLTLTLGGKEFEAPICSFHLNSVLVIYGRGTIGKMALDGKIKGEWK